MLKTYTKKHRRSNNKTQKTKIQYLQEDYESNNGMLTTIWGPATWHLLHSISFNYPVNPTDSDKQNYKEFILSLKNILPCGKCRKNLVNNLKKCPLEQKDLETRDAFSKYIYNLHETVNSMLGKKSGLNYDDVRDIYEHFRARCATSIKGGKTAKKDEKGCVVPILPGEKNKCILRIVPQTRKCKTFM
jgi:hypothetical protein